MSEVPEHPHHMWICRKSKYEIKYPQISKAITEFVPIDEIVGMTEEVAVNQKIKYSIHTEQFKKLKEDIKRRGMRDPIILKRKKGKPKGFHGVHRYLAAKQLGYKYIPCKII